MTTVTLEDASGVMVDATVGDGDVLELGNATLEFIHTPGHTMGSLCILHRQVGSAVQRGYDPGHGDYGDQP